MASDHLNELRRQRALVQQQLDWLDREIAKGDPTDQVPPVKPTIRTSHEAAPAQDVLIPEPDPVVASQDAKRGCLFAFFTLMALLAALMVALYFWKYRDRPVLFADRTASEASP